MLGERIEALRKARGLTQEDLSHALGLSKSAISMYESSKRRPDYDTLARLADFFSVTADYLLGGGAEGGDATYRAAVDKARKFGITQQELLLAIDFLIQAKERDEADA